MSTPMDVLQAAYRKLGAQLDGVVEQLNQKYRPEVQAAQGQLEATQRHNEQLLRRLSEVEAKLRAATKKVSDTPKSPEEALKLIPGYRHPQWYPLRILFEANATGAQTGQVQISTEGPFLITDIDMMFEVLANEDGTVNDATGRYIPVSGMRFFAEQGASGTLAAITTILNTFQPEFDFEIEVDGSGRIWTSDVTPAFVLDPTQRTNYVGTLGWIDPTDSIRVTATPKLPATDINGDPLGVPLRGNFVVVFSGFEIVNPVRLADIMRM